MNNTNELGPERSLINISDSEWRTREINVMSLVRSFLSQISPGQDLTKISLPSVLCHPFSMLELISHRELLLFHILFELDQINDPLERFLIIVKWFLSLTRTETLEKKPFNPVIGETHMCWVDHPSQSAESPASSTEFISEQVSHHPPVSAFFMRNSVHNLTVEGATWFGVKLSTNSATVSTSGGVTVTTDRDVFELSKVVPDLNICNTVMPGKKYILWSGEVKISCPQSGYIATIITEERYYRTNGIQGFISHRDDPNKKIFQIDGVCGQKTYYWNPEKPREKILLLDLSLYKESSIQYLPRHLRSEFDSLRLWVHVQDAIIKNDMDTADKEKKKIEAAQRIRQAEKINSGKQDEGTYFKRDPDSLNANWQFRDNVSVADLIRTPVPGTEAHPPEVPANVIAAPQDLNHHTEGTTSTSTAIPIPKSDQSPPDSLSGSPPDPLTDPDTHMAGGLPGKEDGDQSVGGRDRKSTKIRTNGTDLKKNPEDDLHKKKKDLKKAKKEIVQKAKELKLKGGLIPVQDIIKAGPIKMRNSFKKWNPRYAILLEGRLIYFTNQQEAEKEICRGIILLPNCYVTERPSKKDGFCIKIFNTLNRPIFSRQDLKGKPLNRPLGVFSNYCLLRLKSKEEGKDWLNHLIKAIPDFDQTKSFLEKNNHNQKEDADNSSDGNSGPDMDPDGSDSSLADNPEMTSMIPIGTPAPATAPVISGTSGLPLATAAAAGAGTPGGQSTPQNPSPRNQQQQHKLQTKGIKIASKKNLTPELKANNGGDPIKSTEVAQSNRSGDLIGSKLKANNHLSGLSSEETKDLLSQLRNALKDDLTKVIESKLEDQSKSLTSKIEVTEAHIAYSLRLPAPPPALSPASKSASDHAPKSLPQKLLFIIRTQCSLNTVLLLVIIYLLLSIYWML